MGGLLGSWQRPRDGGREGRESNDDAVARRRGLGVAGSGHHLYSRRFLDAFPQIVHDRGIGMIDAWVGELCDGESEEPRKGHLRCYTLHCDGCEATEGPV